MRLFKTYENACILIYVLLHVYIACHLSCQDLNFEEMLKTLSEFS